MSKRQEYFYDNIAQFKHAKQRALKWVRVLNEIKDIVQELTPIDDINDLDSAMLNLDSLLYNRAAARIPAPVEGYEVNVAKAMESVILPSTTAHVERIQVALNGLPMHNVPWEILEFKAGKVKLIDGFEQILRDEFRLPVENEKQKWFKDNIYLYAKILNSLRSFCLEHNIHFSLTDPQQVVRLDPDNELRLNKHFFEKNKYSINKIGKSE